MATQAAEDGDSNEGGQGGRPPPAKGPTKLSAHSWGAALKRTGKEFQNDDLTDRAAALTYYGVLALFPALLAVMSLLGLFGSAAIDPVLDKVKGFAPGPARNTLSSMLQQLRGGTGGAGIVLVIGVLVALWSASGYVSAFMRAANAVYDIGEGRPFLSKLLTRFFTTVAVVVMLVVVAVAVVFTGSFAQKAGDLLGLGETAVTVWGIAKWPVMLLLVSLVIALLYWAAPNVRRRFRWVTPGGLLAVLIWIVASLAFGFYVANFGSYNKTYGSLTAIIVFLIWLWISNLAILLGLEFDAELERQRAVDTGHPEDEEPYAEPRDTRKL